MNKIRILSDLHLESAPWRWRSCGEDILVLAGDIASLLACKRRRELWKQIEKSGIPTIYVLGNHEAYGDWIPRNDLVKSIRLELPSNIILLERESISIKGLRFLGCPLWTDFSLRYQDCPSLDAETSSSDLSIFEQSISDFTFLCLPNRIDGLPKRIRASDMVNWHREDVAWLSKTILTSNEPTVVVTHFLPSQESIHSQYRESKLNPYFATDCRSLMKPPIRLWVHGHSHSSCDYVANGVRTVCNPRGYASTGQQENNSFRPNFMIEL